MLAIAIAALGIAGCGGDAKKSGSGSSTRPAAKPASLSITTSDVANKRFSMQAPSSIKGGVVEIRFKNAGKTPHEAQLLRIDAGHTLKDVLKLSGTAARMKIPTWTHLEGGVATTGPGQQGSATENLPAGHYVVTDDGAGDPPAPTTRGAVAEFDVTSGPEGQLPAADSTIKVVDKSKHEFEFQTSGLKAGPNKLLFDNASKDGVHHVVAFPMRPGASIADVKAAFAQQGKPSGPPPVDFANGTGTAILDAQRELVTTLDLHKGRYALVCFLNDRDDVKPHFKEGLLKEVTVP